jgi:hypothetical protein
MNRSQLVLGTCCLLVAIAAFTTFQGYPQLGDLLREGVGAVQATSWSEVAYDFHLTALLVFLCILVVALFGASLVILTFLNRERPKQPPATVPKQPHLHLV